MSLYVLDTDTLSLYQFRHLCVLARVTAVGTANLAVTIISVQEQLLGWHSALQRVRKPDDIARLYGQFATAVRSLAGLQILSYTASAVHRFNNFPSFRPPIGGADRRIAAIALEMGAVLVTRNLRDFQRIPGFTLEDWSV